MWPLTVRAQQPAGMPRVISLAPVHVASRTEGTRRILRELGYVEGLNIRLELVPLERPPTPTRDELNVRSTFRFNALMMPMRAIIVGP
jgi:hypothetical protein